MSADLMPASWADIDESPASAEPMQQTEYDAIRDDIREAMYDDRALLPELFWYAVSSLAVLAQTGTEPVAVDPTQVLRRMVQRAKDGVPMNEPEGEL